MPEFDPRAAALAEAYAAAVAASMNQGDGNPVVWEDEAVQGVVAGLVYIGDQIDRLAEGDADAAFRWPPPSGTRLMFDGEEVDARRITVRFDTQVGTRPAPRVVDPAEYLPYLEARLVEVLEGGRARFTVGPSLFEVRLGETFRLYAPWNGPDVQVERGYKAALEKIANYQDHFGAGPPDDEMREIALTALRGGVDVRAGE